MSDGQGSSYRQSRQGRAGQAKQKDLGNFRIWFSGLGISTLGPGFHKGGFTVAFGHGHPLVIYIFACCVRASVEVLKPSVRLSRS